MSAQSAQVGCRYVAEVLPAQRSSVPFTKHVSQLYPYLVLTMGGVVTVAWWWLLVCAFSLWTGA